MQKSAKVTQKKPASAPDINTLVGTVEEQQNIIRNQQNQINDLVKALKRSGAYSGKSGLVETKGGKIISIKGKNSKKKTQYDYLINTIKKIGHAVTTDQIAAKLKKESPKFKTMASRKPRSYMQFIYSAVSHLSNKGILNRHSVNEKGYEYSLPEFDSKQRKAS
jgi:hypothetical protein